MSKVLRIDQGDYKLKVQDNGTIILDTGERIGEVIVTGDLNVHNTMTAGMTITDESVLLFGQTPDKYTGGIKLYAKTETVSGTGVYFINPQDEFDEFVSRRKALAYSMIF